MTDTIITMEQILALSDLNRFFQFIYLHQSDIYFFFFLSILFLWLKEVKNSIFIYFVSISFFIVLIMCLFISHAKLNENQIKLIKSVDDAEFQSLVLQFIEQDGVTIGAIGSVLKIKKFDPANQLKQKDIEFYKSVKP
jgi:hypothetical protein